MPSARALRRLWFQVHLWLGVALALLLIPIGLTGVALVWTDELERAAAPRLGAVARPASAYLAAAQAALQGKARPVSLSWPEAKGDPVLVVARPSAPPQAGPGARPGQGEGRGPGGGRPRPVTVKLDPADAHVLATGPSRPQWWRTVHGFHENLMNPGWGRPVVGWLGVGLLISALTGIWLWWPRAGSLAKALRFGRAPGFWRSLHFTAGFWISLPLAFVALTGVGLGFPQQTRALIGQVAPLSPPGNGAGMGGPPGVFGGPPGGDRAGRGDHGAPPWRPALDADRALAAANVPPAAAKSLTLATRAKPVWRVELRDGTAREVADADARVTPAAPAPAGDQAWRWLHRLHGGDGTPLVWRLIVTLTGLAPALFGISGIWLWIARSLRKRALAVPGEAAA